MQQQQGGGRVQYGASPSEMTGFAAAPTTDSRAQMIGPADQHLKLGDPSMGAAEEASPISSRPPATSHFSSAANMEELLPVATGVGGLPDDDALGGDDGDRGGVSGGNRWPRQETLALLKIRSEMDAVFRDASLKGPLWEDVSRKLAELGYKRSAKKCKEKFENVHKYYKRTKEGRAGRQDGKSYRFFTQLEALHNTVISSPTPTPTPTPPTSVITTTAAATIEQVVAPVPVPVSIEIGVGNPMPVSSVRVPSPFLAPQTQSQLPPSIPLFPQPQEFSGVAAGAPAVVQSGFGAAAPLGVSFSSDSSSSSSGSEEMGDEEDDMDLEGDFMASMSSQQRKRKRGSSKQRGSSSEKMMEFFEGLMKQVMQKQETMQQRFLEAIEKREQDRMIREEAWKRQEMSRLAREQELMAQERAISATRDSAIIAFLQKITGQTIQLPQAVTVPIPAAPPPPPPQPPVSVSVPVPAPPPSTLPPPTQLYQKPQQPQPPQQHYQQQQHQVQQPPPSQQQQLVHHHQQQHPQTSEEVARTPQPPPMSSAIVVAIPEQQVAPQEMSGGGGFEATSSRWPKAEVLALIKLRSGLEPRYQEAGPKGPLWEEISSGMQRMGYKRNPKRCKEKWENINKYFKKVKESNKKRPEDAKTCPYFHELDALYRKKILGSPSGGNSLVVTHNRAEEQQPQPPPVMLSIQATQTTDSQNKDIGGTFDMQTRNGGLTASLFGEASDGGVGVPKKPEDIVKEQQHQQVQKHQQPLMRNGFDKIEEPDSDNLDLEEDEYNDEDEDEDDEDEDAQEEMKMAYKIQYQRPNAGSSNGGGNGAPSFLAMVQ